MNQTVKKTLTNKYMQKIKTLRNKSGESIYPLTSTKAVVDENGNTIEHRLVVADGEDLVTDGNVLRLKDRPNTDGMGYVILRKEKTFQEQVTKPNTIYEIRYDFDLNGAEITIPENCVLKFEGGSLRNGALKFASTRILGSYKFERLNYIIGTFQFGEVRLENISFVHDIDALKFAFLASSLGDEVFLEDREYSISNNDGGFYRIQDIPYPVEENGTLCIVRDKNSFILHGNGAKIKISNCADRINNLILFVDSSNVVIDGLSIIGDIDYFQYESGDFSKGIHAIASQGECANFNIRLESSMISIPFQYGSYEGAGHVFGLQDSEINVKSTNSRYGLRIENAQNCVFNVLSWENHRGAYLSQLRNCTLNIVGRDFSTSIFALIRSGVVYEEGNEHPIMNGCSNVKISYKDIGSTKGVKNSVTGKFYMPMAEIGSYTEATEEKWRHEYPVTFSNIDFDISYQSINGEYVNACPLLIYGTKISESTPDSVDVNVNAHIDSLETNINMGRLYNAGNLTRGTINYNLLVDRIIGTSKPVVTFYPAPNTNIIFSYNGILTFNNQPSSIFQDYSEQLSETSFLTFVGCDIYCSKWGEGGDTLFKFKKINVINGTVDPVEGALHNFAPLINQICYAENRPVSSVLGGCFYDRRLPGPIYWDNIWRDALGVIITNVDSRIGTTDKRKSMTLSSANEGFLYYDTTLGKLILWNGTEWVESDSQAAGIKRAGTWSQRPNADGSFLDNGFQYFLLESEPDEDPDGNPMESITGNGKPIWWIQDGRKWVDAFGNTITGGSLGITKVNEVRHIINGEEYKFLTTDEESHSATIYAPSELENDGYVVVQQDNKAKFVDPADIGLK